ncbi:hypothetical protein [Paraburkholderia dinghuensis]|uniref:Uncharacterized protein n=1 Tax=Paraburkholderia dinghuensis TaxID=2305225 RepID=A0A3N6N1M7_9BURK|nr:hypothetical protein [Paraburkholderia dinghuensis]RQH02732.1 hypothetical protein D1Y85_21605 [Paraburkholderia dinghuensis]
MMIFDSNRTIGADEIRELVRSLCDQLRECPDDTAIAGDLQQVVGLLDEAQNCAGNATGFVLVADHYFERYAQEVAADLGQTEGWPYDCIDWTRAIAAMQMDYRQLEFDGMTYWVRA